MMSYVGSLPGIETIFNAWTVIETRLKLDPTIHKHNILKVEYSTDFGTPSVRYAQLLERMLEEHDYPWRIHSVHADFRSKLTKILLRPPSMTDLMHVGTEFSKVEMSLLGILQKLAVAMGKEPLVLPKDQEWPLQYYLLPSPATARVFVEHEESKDIRIIFKSVFDVWYYDGKQWDYAASDGDERAASISRSLPGVLTGRISDGGVPAQ